jgi:hypothetical protein
LLVPSTDPEDRRRHDDEVEKIAVRIASEYEREQGWVARDLSTPPLARAAGLSDMQADVTNMGDLWAMRSYVIEQMGGLPPNHLICNSGLTETGYAFGRALCARSLTNSSRCAAREVRQQFIDNLEQSRIVLDTKIDGFLAMTHLWAGEAVYHQEFL